MFTFKESCVGCASNFALTCIRAMISQQVNETEQGKAHTRFACTVIFNVCYRLGKLFGFFAVFEDISLICGTVIFNTLYPLTRSIFNGLMFASAAVVLILPLGILILFIKTQKWIDCSSSVYSCQFCVIKYSINIGKTNKRNPILVLSWDWFWDGLSRIFADSPGQKLVRVLANDEGSMKSMRKLKFDLFRNAACHGITWSGKTHRATWCHRYTCCSTRPDKPRRAIPAILPR